MCKPNESIARPKQEDEEDVQASSPEDASPSDTEESAGNKNVFDIADEEEENKEDESRCRRLWKRTVDFYWTNEFLVLVIVAILLARAYPPLGAVYLAPHITATWVAVCFIFLMAGLGLKTEEFSKAFRQIWFNLYVQVFNFGVDSSIVYGISRLLAYGNVLSQDLADGLTIAASLPMTINMVLVLTKSAGGDEAGAIFNAAFGNLAGVFLSPVLILGYLGVSGSLDLVSVFYKLALRVLLPIAIGQILQKTSKRVVDFVKKNKKYFKRAQQYALVFIVYTVFCRTFYQGTTSSVGDIFLTVLFVFLLLTTLMVIAWFSLRLVFRDRPKQRVLGLFACTHKTVAMGVPLINAIYENNPAVGLYTLPLLIWHPMQLVIGSLLAPRLAAFVKRECERLGIDDEDAEEFDVENVSKDEGEEVSESEDLSETEEGRIRTSSEETGEDEGQASNADDGLSVELGTDKP